MTQPHNQPPTTDEEKKLGPPNMLPMAPAPLANACLPPSPTSCPYPPPPIPQQNTSQYSPYPTTNVQPQPGPPYPQTMYAQTTQQPGMYPPNVMNSPQPQYSPAPAPHISAQPTAHTYTQPPQPHGPQLVDPPQYAAAAHTDVYKGSADDRECKKAKKARKKRGKRNDACNDCCSCMGDVFECFFEILCCCLDD